ncbi:hypothetical protein ABRY23_06885 [Melioribacteraceae bacterium 4301-Me]|uniref:hypothetical protein n=1 Tax=Pyranulibacter aquaticus TaxID=3163344 RepID=UPI003599A36A
MRKVFLFLVLITTTANAQLIKFGEAKGLFMSIGVGPRFPIAVASESQNIGVGFNVSISYTDNNFLPVFFYSTFSYNHFPGKQNFYKVTDYSSFSTNSIIFSPGVRYYFSPVINEGVLLMPIADFGFSLALYEKLHQFKIGTGKQNFVEEVGYTGFHIGGGFSMFILDVITYYNFIPNNQFISFDLKIRIPIYVTI